MDSKKTKKRKLYKSCNTIPIYHFYKIMETNDYRFMIKGFDFENDEDLKLSKFEVTEYSNIFGEIVFDYLDLLENKKLVQNYKTKMVISKLERKYVLGLKFMEIYLEYGFIECLDGLELAGYKIKKDCDIVDVIDNVKTQILALSTKIKLRKIKYADRFLKDNDNDKMNLEREALKIEKILDLKYGIDVMTTTVAKWISMINLSKTYNNSNR